MIPLLCSSGSNTYKQYLASRNLRTSPNPNATPRDSTERLNKLTAGHLIQYRDLWVERCYTIFFCVIPLGYPERKNYGSRVSCIVVYVNLALSTKPAHSKVAAERGPNTLTPKLTDARWLPFHQQIQTGCAWQLMTTGHQASFHTS